MDLSDTTNHALEDNECLLTMDMKLKLWYSSIKKLEIFIFQTPASDFPGLEDDLVFSGAGSGCNGDDEDECPPLPESGSGDDDLITPVYIPPTRPPPTIKTKAPPPSCDDEDCFTGSGGGEVTEDTTNATSATTGNYFWFHQLFFWSLPFCIDPKYVLQFLQK